MRFFILAFIVTTFVLPLSVAHAAPTAAISVPEEGDFLYWFSYTGIKGDEIITTPVSFEGVKTTADLPLVKDAVPKCRLFVLNTATGNEAMVEIDPSEEDEAFKFDLKESDFDRVRRVRIFVVSSANGQPVASAVVKLEDSEAKTHTNILDPSAAGVVEFMDVPSGTAKVAVAYDEGKTASHDVDVALDREELVPRIEVPVVGNIRTIEAAAEEGALPGAPSGRSPAGGINFAMALVGLVLFVGILYAAYVLMRNRGVGFKQILKKAGVELPDDQPAGVSQETAPAATVDPSVCPFCGGKKDPATGQCSCSVGAAPAATPGAASGPRLIATQGEYSGGIYTLDADTITIGREEANVIALPRDVTVSRRHARLGGSPETGEFTIYDEGSSNGTFVNGVRITEQVLRPGDEIQIGSTRLRFET